MKPNEKLIIAVGDWLLIYARCPHLPYCWFKDAGQGYKAEGRNDSLIYRAGFKTKERAEAWAKKEKIMPQ